MKSENIDLQPAYRLLDKHTQHITPYEIEFRGINLLLHPEVFNPVYTKVSGFLLDNYVGNSVEFVHNLANAASLDMSIKAEWDVGYEVYRILEFHPKQ